MNEGKGGGEGKKAWVSKLLGLFLHIMGFAPLICGFVFSDFRLGSSVALGIALLNFVLSFLSYRAGRTKTWPKVLDVIFISLFGVLTILAWADQKRDEVYKYWSGAIINGGLLLGIIISWLCGHPFVEDYMIDSLGTDRTGLTFPLIRHHTIVMTGVWLGVFMLMEAVSVVGGVRSLFEPKPDQQFLYAFTQPGYITFILLGLASAFNVVYRRAYQNQEGQRRARLAKRYEQEVNDWVSSNPEHPISERYREKLREEKGYTSSP